MSNYSEIKNEIFTDIVQRGWTLKPNANEKKLTQASCSNDSIYIKYEKWSSLEKEEK